MRVALVQDWLTGFRGGEKVLHEFAGMFPEADLYTLIHVRGSTSERIDRLNVHASPLSRLPGAARHYRKLLPLFPLAIERFRLDDESQLLAAVAATVRSLEQLAEGLSDQLTSASSRGVLDTAARRLADVSALLRDGQSRAARATA